MAENGNCRLIRILLPAAAGALLSLPLATAVLRAQVPGALPATRPAATRPTTEPTPDSIAFTLGDEKVTFAEYDAFVNTLPQQDQQMARGPYRRAWADSFINMKLLAREAQKRKVDQDPNVQRQLAGMREQVLANAMVNNLQENLDEAFLKKYFEEHRAQLERIAARHILIRVAGSRVPLRPGQKDMTDAEAKAKADQLSARLKAGEDFAKLARDESDDTGSAVEGGDLGSFTRGRMVAPFEKAAFGLKENEISAPVKSDFGWHIIQVTGRFDSYEKLADVLRQQLGPQRTNQLVKELRAQTKVDLSDAVFGPPLPAEVDPTTLPK